MSVINNQHKKVNMTELRKYARFYTIEIVVDSTKQSEEFNDESDWIKGSFWAVKRTEMRTCTREDFTKINQEEAFEDMT